MVGIAKIVHSYIQPIRVVAQTSGHDQLEQITT